MSSSPIEPSPTEDGLDQLRSQLPILTNMLKAIKTDPTTPFSGYTYHFAARFFFQLGQTQTALDLLDRAVTYFGENHPFCKDCRRDYLDFVNSKFNLPMDIANVENAFRLWIFNPEGLDLYCHNPYEHTDPMILGGFFSAIRSLCRNLNENKELSTLIVEDRVYHIISREPQNFFLIALIPAFIPPTNVDKCLNEIADAFWDLYRSELMKMTGAMDKFRTFNPNFTALYDGIGEDPSKLLSSGPISEI